MTPSSKKQLKMSSDGGLFIFAAVHPFQDVIFIIEKYHLSICINDKNQSFLVDEYLNDNSVRPERNRVNIFSEVSLLKRFYMDQCNFRWDKKKGRGENKKGEDMAGTLRRMNTHADSKKVKTHQNHHHAATAMIKKTRTTRVRLHRGF
jgi:hypothetical protein